MSDSKAPIVSQIVSQHQLLEAEPSLSKSKLNYWARQEPPVLPFGQPAGPGGERFYDLNVVRNILAGRAAQLHHPKTNSPSSPAPASDQVRSPARRGRVGKGLASYPPKKRGPKSAKAEGGA